VQLLAVDLDAARRAWKTSAEVLARHLDEAWVVPLQALRAGAPLAQQASQSPRLVERVGHLYGTLAATPAAPEELWADVAFPLLQIGVPDALPPVASGALLSTAPRRFPPPREALLGAFELEQVRRPDRSLESIAAPRFLQVDVEAVRAALEAFDAKATRAFLKRYVF
jgi:hypothetical protein